MAVVEVPVFPDRGAFTQRVVLDDRPYTLTGRYNTRMGLWVMDAQDEAGNDLVNGMPLVADWSLSDAFKGRIAGLWLGELFTLDVTGRRRPAGLENLGTEVKLYYLEYGT
jgi:hypothetical protein